MSDGYVAISDPDCPYCGGGGYLEHVCVDDEVDDTNWPVYFPVTRADAAAMSADLHYAVFGQEGYSRCYMCDCTLIYEYTVKAMIAELRRLGVSDVIWQDARRWLAAQGVEPPPVG